MATSVIVVFQATLQVWGRQLCLKGECNTVSLPLHELEEEQDVRVRDEKFG